MESSSAQASLGEGSKNGSQASRYVAAIEDMFWVCDKSRPDSSDAERIPDHRVRQGRQGRVEFPDFKDGKVAESSTKPTQCGLPKTDRILPGSAWPAVGRRPQGCPRWPVPATEAQESCSPRGQARRCVTSRAVPAAGINAGRLSYSLDWENLSDAERNLRVRLSET
jgi:hypothetical protein